jgi:hypothetical protein
MKAQNSYLPSF